MNAELREWLDDFGYEWRELIVVGGVIFVFLALIAAGLASESNRKHAACERMWAAARTSADTIAVLAKCELGDEPQTVVVPVYVQ
jgi:hypothetical protein